MLSGLIVRKMEQNRIGIVIEPYFNRFFFKEVAISLHKLNLVIAELNLLIVRAVKKRVILY